MQVATITGCGTSVAASDMMNSVNVARKGAGAGGLLMILGLLLVSCAGATGFAESSNAPPMPKYIAVKVPDAGWRLRVEHVVELDAEVWVLAQLSRAPGPAAQMIQQARAEIPITLPEKNLRVFVAGKKWGWSNEETYEFVASLDEVIRRAGSARELYPPPAK
jgi:hypothetical protein